MSVSCYGMKSDGSRWVRVRLAEGEADFEHPDSMNVHEGNARVLFLEALRLDPVEEHTFACPELRRRIIRARARLGSGSAVDLLGRLERCIVAFQARGATHVTWG
ncbi:MAG: hypothetical protein AMXMBFR56_65710 [Polyangiaceae bacterium]